LPRMTQPVATPTTTATVSIAMCRAVISGIVYPIASVAYSLAAVVSADLRAAAKAL